MRTISPPVGRRSAPARLALTLAIACGSLAAASAPAHAAGCDATFDPVAHVLTIGGCTADPDAPVTARISRTAAGAIELDGQDIAGGPTVTNTDEIVYDGADGADDQITLDMSNGLFKPGFTPEIVSSNEIEIDIDGGTAGADFVGILGDDGASDTISVGAHGIDLTQDGDSDISRQNVSGRIVVDGQGGHDTLRGTYPGSSSSEAPVELRGGSGDDVLTGGLSNDELDGGPGQDSVVGQRAGGFTLSPTTLTGHGADTLTSIEEATLTGNSGSDTIDASAFNGPVTLDGASGDDTLRGGAGPDHLSGYFGDDTIEGGPGYDVMDELVLGDMTLTDGAMTGAGPDGFDSIEHVAVLSGGADQRFDASGFGGSLKVVAGGGADTLIGGPGFNEFHGGEGADELTGGLGFDALRGDAGDDRIFSDDGVSEQVVCGDGADAVFADALDGLVGCEQIQRGVAPQPGPGEDPGGSVPPGIPDAPSEPALPATPVTDTVALPATPVTDTVAPSLSRLDLARARLRAAGRGTGLAAASVGTPVRFTLSERASVTFKVLRAATGGRFVRLRGKLTHGGAAGANRVVLRGRLAGRALAPGRYLLVARATDAAGNRSAARRAAFRIVAR